MTKYLIVPDSYKGCLSSYQVGRAIASGINRADPTASVMCFRVADGGEGTVEAFVEAVHGSYQIVTAKDCFLDTIKATIGILDHETAIMEVANIVGLAMLQPEQLDPYKATSYGVGMVLKEIAASGFKRIIIGLGGSSTNDGGMGMLQALGARFYDRNHQLLGCGAWAMAQAASVDLTDLYDFKTTQLIVASDVRNKLLGPQGATLIYGPQKGADSNLLAKLEKAMDNYSRVLAGAGLKITETECGGAAGGLGAALIGVLKAQRSSGIQLLLQTMQFERLLTPDTIVISGEGQSDAQSAYGKVIAGIAAYTQPAQVPLYIISGALKDGYQELFALGVTKAYALLDAAKDRRDSFENAERLLTEITAKLVKSL